MHLGSMDFWLRASGMRRVGRAMITRKAAKTRIRRQRTWPRRRQLLRVCRLRTLSTSLTTNSTPFAQVASSEPLLVVVHSNTVLPLWSSGHPSFLLTTPPLVSGNSIAFLSSSKPIILIHIHPFPSVCGLCGCSFFASSIVICVGNGLY